MAQQITQTQTKFNGYVTVRSDATGFINLNGGAQNANSAGETVVSATIAGIHWSVSGTNRWTIARGANTVAQLAGNGSWNLQSMNTPLESTLGDKEANTVFTLSGGNGTVLIRLHKQSGE
jgi:hypothetical protein